MWWKSASSVDVGTNARPARATALAAPTYSEVRVRRRAVRCVSVAGAAGATVSLILVLLDRVAARPDAREADGRRGSGAGMVRIRRRGDPCAAPSAARGMWIHRAES